MNNEFELFPGKNLGGLFEDIYKNQKLKKRRIAELIHEIKTKIRNINDWIVIGPLIRDLIDTSVRNDEALIKLATIAQRLASSSSKVEGEDGFLTDEEKRQLLKDVEEVADIIENDEEDEVKKLEKQVNELETKIKK